MASDGTIYISWRFGLKNLRGYVGITDGIYKVHRWNGLRRHDYVLIKHGENFTLPSSMMTASNI
jgi:hypothetical protein